MNDKPDNVVDFRSRAGVRASRGYLKFEADRLVGRTFVTTNTKGTPVGRIVDTYAYRDEGGRVRYGVKTEYKSLAGGLPMEGSLRRHDLERGGSFLVPQCSTLVGQIPEYLKSTEKPSQELLETIHVETYAAKHQRSHSEGIIL